ncbi:MAG: WbuC family cupin fold metalloprotein [Kiritimatiellae bacterium]|nr:WbuC family cupin fold metalloprotein [Kiritimatiellia bacterium]
MARTERVMLNREAVLVADRRLINALIRRAKASPDHSYRLCLHESPRTRVQEMIVVCDARSTRPPHCHPGFAETHWMIRGEIMVVLFDGRGRVVRRIELGPPEGRKPFCVRVAAGQWHMIVFRTSPVVYYEVMRGPFVRKRTNVWADWAPSPDDPAGLTRYLRKRGLA